MLLVHITPVGFKFDLLCTRFWYCKISVNLSQQSVPTGESSHANDLPQPGHCGQTVTSLNLREGQIIETNMCVYIYIYFKQITCLAMIDSIGPRSPISKKKWDHQFFHFIGLGGLGSQDSCQSRTLPSTRKTSHRLRKALPGG